MPKIGRRAIADRFDPNAIDGDGDGIVQELTRFERPSTARVLGGAMSQNPDRYPDFVPEIIDVLVNDPSLYDLAPKKIPSVISDIAGGNADMFNRSRIRNVSPVGRWSQKEIMSLVDDIKIETAPDGIFTIVAPPVPEVRELIDFDGEFSNVRIPSPDARLRMYKSILENLKPNKNTQKSYSENLGEQLYKKVSNGLFIPRGEYGKLRESLGEQYMPGSDSHPFDAIYERFLRVPSEEMFIQEMYQMEYIQMMHDFYGHLGTGRGFDRHGEWANYLAMVHAAEGVNKGNNEILDQIAFELFQRIMINQLEFWENIDAERGVSTAQEARRLLQDIGDREEGSYIDRNTMRQIIGIDDPSTYSQTKTKSLSNEPKTIKRRAIAYIHSFVDNNIVETGQGHSSFVKQKKNAPIEKKSLRKFSKFDRFNPNAIDGDNDGIVQELTRFERPAQPKISGNMGRLRTQERIDRDKRIVSRWKNKESIKKIAKEEETTEAAVSWVINQARKRGEITEERRSTPPYTRGVPASRTPTPRPSGPKEKNKVLSLYDSGKSIDEIAKLLSIPKKDVYRELTMNRLSDVDGKFTIPRQMRGLSGAIRGTEPEVWQRQSSRIRAISNDDDELGELPGGALYDEGTGPRQRNPRLDVDNRQVGDENAQDILVDIAQEIAMAKREKTAPGKERKKRPYKKSQNNTSRVTGLNRNQRKEYIKQRNDLIQEELEKGELSVRELAEIFDLNERTIFQIAGKPARTNVSKRKQKNQSELKKEIVDYIKKSKPTTAPINLIKIIKSKYGLSDSYIRKTFKKEIDSFNKKRNSAIRKDLQNADLLAPILSKYSINRTQLKRIANDILKEKNFQAESRAVNQSRTTRTIKKRQVPLNSSTNFTPTPLGESDNTIDLTQPMPNRTLRGRGKKGNELSGSMSSDRLSPVKTAGLLSGMMSNENPSVNKKIEVKSDVKKEGSKILVNLQYGDIPLSFDFEDGKYFEWTDAYDMWAGWRGNYSMRLASAALMGEPLPKAFGYTGDELGTHHHDLLGNGVSPDISRSEITEMTDSVRSAFIGLDFINQGSEISTDIEYRGLSGIDSSDEIMKARNGDSIVLPLSAFTSDITTALSYSSNQFDETGEEFILAIEPGAKIANAAGEEYQHEFLKNGKWVIDVTEQVTQGRFLVKSIRTSFVKENGKQRKIKIVNLQQSETFNPRTGKWERISGFKPNLSGNMSSPEARKDIKLKQLAENVEIVKGLIPSSEEQMREMLAESFIKRNQAYVKQDIDIQKSKPWNSDNPPLNPDGSKMSEKQYLDFIKASRSAEAAEFLSQNLNPYNPDFTPNHIRQLAHNVSLTLTISPGLKQLLDEYGYPIYGIFLSQRVDGKFIPNEEAFKLPEVKAARGLSIMQLGVSAVLPIGKEDFIQSEDANSVPSDNRTRFDGHWGINPSVYISNWDGEGEFSPLYEDAKRIAEVSQAAQDRVFFVDSGSPAGIIRHETMHSVHYGALVSALKKYTQNPADKNAEDAYKFLAALVKAGGWQAIPDYLRKMMIDNAVSSYALTSPVEWFAETLSASMSPNDFTRRMVTPEARSFLATVLPEMADYFTKGRWG